MSTSEHPTKEQSAGWCNRCGGVLTSFERGSKLCANCEEEYDQHKEAERERAEAARDGDWREYYP